MVCWFHESEEWKDIVNVKELTQKGKGAKRQRRKKRRVMPLRLRLAKGGGGGTEPCSTGEHQRLEFMCSQELLSSCITRN